MYPAATRTFYFNYLSAVDLSRIDKMQIIILSTMLLYGVSFMSLAHGFSTARRTFGKLITNWLILQQLMLYTVSLHSCSSSVCGKLRRMWGLYEPTLYNTLVHRPTVTFWGRYKEVDVKKRHPMFKWKMSYFNHRRSLATELPMFYLWNKSHALMGWDNNAFVSCPKCHWYALLW